MSQWRIPNKKKRKSEEYDSDGDDDGSEPDFGDDEEDEHVPDESDEDEDDFEDGADIEMDDRDLESSTPNDSSLLFKFPVRVSFDGSGKAQHIPGPPISASPNSHKRPRAAHRKIIVSDESTESTDVSPDRREDGHEDDEEDEDDSAQEPEEPAAEEIVAVPLKRVVFEPPPCIPTPASTSPLAREHSTAAAAVALPAGDVPAKRPPTPVNRPSSTPLAFRGSPEKPLQQQPVVPKPIDA